MPVPPASGHILLQVTRDLRHALIILGGATTIAHGYHGPSVHDYALTLAHVDDAAKNRQARFHKDASNAIVWDARLASPDFDWFITVELLVVLEWAVPRCPVAVGFGNGFVTTLPELVLFRCETILSRGKPVDYLDLQHLL